MRLAVFVSGKGTNLLNIIKRNQEGFLRSEIILVISNHECEAIENSQRAGIRTKILDSKSLENEIEFGNVLLEVLRKNQIEFVVLAGFLKKIPDVVVKSFQNKIINVHPALLPSFGGKGMYGMKVHQAVIDYGCKVSGATVHLVDSEYDHGPVILQRCVPVSDDDTAETLASKIHQLEYELLPEALKLFEENKVQVAGRKVRIYLS
ncbi:MAG: phosphoribosylglycinamide formyltransferase [Bacteroidetes bacterium]|nr:phosphoribosylglycinamide formyltransferase [Bacteroidota bacterium]